MSYEAPRLQMVKDNMVRVHNPDPLEPSTYLTASVAATGTSLTVAANSGFSNGDLVLFEGYGRENAEIKKIDAAVTAGTALTVTAVTFGHAIDCGLNRVIWDQVEILGATTATGTKTSIATINLNVSGPYTDYVVTGTTYAFYFVRFYNSDTAASGSYSDAIAYTDFAPNTVGFVRRAAFDNVDQPFEGKFTSQWVYDQLYQCELDVLKTKDKWSSMVELNYDLGDVTRCMSSVAMPSDIEDKQTNKSILGIRIAGRDNMEYVDNEQMHRIQYDVHRTTLYTTAVTSDVILVLTDSNDFDDSGSVMIAGTEYAYTANDRTTNTLSGLTALSAGITSGVDVWQGIDEGEPRRFTVMDGYVYFDTPPDDDWEDKNLYMDYYKTAQRYTTDNSALLMNDPGVYIYWLEKEIKRKKSSGEIPAGDVSQKEYERRKMQLAMKDKNPYKLRFVPAVPITRPRHPFSWWKK